MTRINLVPVESLTGQHLLAEHHELPKVYNYVRAAIKRGDKPDLNNPPTYRMGEGHVKFFYPRLGWLRKRELELIQELIRRGNTYVLPEDISDIPSEWFNDWEPNKREISINRARIELRLEQQQLQNTKGYLKV